MLMLMIAHLTDAKPSPPAKRTVYVEVDGSKYRVTTRGGEVEVAKKAIVVRYTLAERDRLREAVRRATGCRIVDELAPNVKLKGKLDCEKVS